jgi:hypothetical protein
MLFEQKVNNNNVEQNRTNRNVLEYSTKYSVNMSHEYRLNKTHAYRLLHVEQENRSIHDDS